MTNKENFFVLDEKRVIAVGDSLGITLDKSKVKKHKLKKGDILREVKVKVKVN